MNTMKKLATAITLGALLTQSLAPLAAAETFISVSGNGSSSDNKVDLKQKSETTVVQTNNATVTNKVSGSASTGHNDANDNTGGDVAIKTGDAKSSVEVSNMLNKNVADVNTCDCDGDVKLVIDGNGSYSDNEIKLNKKSETKVFQTNDAKVTNNVDANAKTGGNDANRNTGGDTTIITGDAWSQARVSTAANSNSATMNRGHNSGQNDVQAFITGNGSYSDNEIKQLNLDRDLLLTQDNDARIYNYVDVDAKTGYNDANDNTGGDVVIKTGDALAKAMVDNLINFNMADIDCGCVLGGKFVIDGNGYNSDNEIKAKLDDERKLFQLNDSWVENDVDANAKTGGNDAKRNTGPTDRPDPVVIMTGDAQNQVGVSNTSNSNVIGNAAGFPELPDVEVDLDFDFIHFLWFFWSHMSSSN